ncbi:MAG: pyridoxamine 5'-phosphate oxidase family protein [Solirubrobacteraceae bacterium]
MRGKPEFNAMARRVIDANNYLVLGTRDPDGSPRLSPVYYTPARYSDFYWVSSPQAHHSRNLTERPAVDIVIFDSTAPIGNGEAVYLAATARPIPDDELEAACPTAFRTTAGARRFEPDELRGGGVSRTLKEDPCKYSRKRCCARDGGFRPSGVGPAGVGAKPPWSCVS